VILDLDTLTLVKSSNSGDTIEMEKPSPEDIASIIYTSGTSGASKGVMLTHANLVAQTRMSYDLFPINHNDVFLSILPLSHAYECSIGMLFPLTFGAKIVYLNGAPTPSLLMPALKLVKPTIILSVPLVVEKIYKLKIRPMFTKNVISRILYSIGIVRRALHRIAGKKLTGTFGGKLRFFGIGGSKLDGAVEYFLRDAGFPYAIGYGLTETSPLLAGATPGKVKWQSTGPALNGLKLKIIEPDNHGIGEIVAKGPNVMTGYF
jgi:long-chain acyl-CoA synthetase